MHVIEMRQLEKLPPMHHLYAAAGVRRTIAEQPTANTVRHSRLRVSQPRVATLYPITHNELGHESRLVKLGDIGRIVLSIAI